MPRIIESLYFSSLCIGPSDIHFLYSIKVKNNISPIYKYKNYDLLKIYYIYKSYMKGIIEKLRIDMLLHWEVFITKNREVNLFPLHLISSAHTSFIRIIWP